MSEAHNDIEIRDLAIKREALLEGGHFLLSSGLHSDKYFQCAKILQWPDDAALCGRKLADKFTAQSIAADLVLSPAMGGLFIGYEVARALGVKSIFLERIDGTFTLKRGFTIEKGARVIIIEDVLTTGKSTLEVIDYIQESTEGIIVGIGSIADRIEESRRQELFAKFSAPYTALLQITATTVDPSKCPECKQGTPAVKPGSRS